jgi:drug/metabolite transporter (DMT)-like permease
VALFGEPITLRLTVSTVLVLGGTALAVHRNLALRPSRTQPRGA